MKICSKIYVCVSVCNRETQREIETETERDTEIETHKDMENGTHYLS